MEVSKKDFCTYIKQQRKMKKDVGLLWNGVSNLVLRDMEKNEVLYTFVATVFYWQDLPSLSDMLRERSRGKGDKLPQGEVRLK